MVRYKPARPALATAICFYEFVVVLLAFLGRSFDRWLQVAHPSRYHRAPFLQTVASEIGITLALFAAVLLWQMHPSAAPLLAIRAALSLFNYLYLVILHPFSDVDTHPQLITSAMAHGAVYTIGSGFVALNIWIAWYVYKITTLRV